ncbi:RNA 3'-terminal phosphate cyclase [Perkinsela sp. CCAP 1560/4]|nr:RNA 3'-terminal phosphate cyclase [Perkinsela sp. CCAP 1560/4]|eukprot:KNH09778.1 RNA 3'-terminal phosphate cyclase [Perkinsela sp. CCAP 1560/4]
MSKAEGAISGQQNEDHPAPIVTEDAAAAENEKIVFAQPPASESFHAFYWLWKEYSEVIITFLSGFSAGTVSRTITAPLDRLKLLMQEGRILQHTMTHPTCHILNCKIKNNANYNYSLFQLIKIVLREGANQKDESVHVVGKESTSISQRILGSLGRIKSACLGRISSLSVFWRGNGINCIKAGPEFALAFGTRQLFQETFFPVPKETVEGRPFRQSFSSQFIVSAAAGATAQIIIYPLELIKTRMAVAGSGEYTSILDCIRQTYRNAVTNASKKLLNSVVNDGGPASKPQVKHIPNKRGRKVPVCNQRKDVPQTLTLKHQVKMRAVGISEFYRGIGANLSGIVPNRGVEMGLFFWLQDLWRQRTTPVESQGGSEPLPMRMSILIGAASSTTAQIVTYPLNLVRLRMQVQGMSGRPVLYKNMLHCFCSIIRKEGYRGLYRGLLPNLLKGVPSSTTMYVVFMSTKNFLKHNLQ